MELLWHIVSYLPTQSIMSLKRCSKLIDRSLPITQRFWRDELVAGAVVQYLFDLDDDQIREKDAELEGTNEQWDWKGLVIELSIMQRAETLWDDSCWEDPALPHGFRNRCRIWRIAEDILKYASETLPTEEEFTAQQSFVEGMPSPLEFKAKDPSVFRKRF